MNPVSRHCEGPPGEQCLEDEKDGAERQDEPIERRVAEAGEVVAEGVAGDGDGDDHPGQQRDEAENQRENELDQEAAHLLRPRRYAATRRLGGEGDLRAFPSPSLRVAAKRIHFSEYSHSGMAWSRPSRSTHASVELPSASSCRPAAIRSGARFAPAWSASPGFAESAGHRTGPGRRYLTSIFASTRKNPWSSTSLYDRPDLAKQFGSALLEVDQVVRMVQQAHPIGFGVADADLDFAREHGFG